MPRQAEPELQGAEALLGALRNRAVDLRAHFVDDPVGLATKFHLKLPKKPLQIMQDLGVYDLEKHGPIEPGLRDLVEDVCSGRVKSAAVVGPRGGGKSMGVSFIEFFLVFMKDYDALNLGGSELQADQVYQYLLSYIESDVQFQKMLKGDALQSKTETLNNAWIRVLTASQKSVRSPHAGGRKKDGRLAGGLLVIDEEAEAAPDIVAAALPTINTARPSVNVRSSTFHNNEGSFAELIENHEDMGYQLYSWDIFDVCERCECTGNTCESEESCFREDHYEEFLDPETGQPEKKLLHKAYCGGRARYADGWIPMTEVDALWKRMRRNHDRWEVEAMGSRPTSKGYVIRSRRAYQENVSQKSAMELYLPGFPVTVCIDWGTVAAGLTCWQEQPGDNHLLLYAEQIEEAGSSQIIGAVLQQKQRFVREFLEAAADIGGGGNYMNPKLRDEHMTLVRDVNFAEEKEAAVAAWNIYNEGGSIIYPAEFGDFHDQIKKWRRKNGRIVKGNDHLMDSSICYFAKFIDRLGLQNIRVPARTFGSNGHNHNEHPWQHVQAIPQAPVMRPMVRTLGSRRR